MEKGQAPFRDARPRSFVYSEGERLLVRFSRLGPRFPSGGRGCIQTSRLTRRKGSRGGLHYHPPALDSLFWGEGESSYLAFTRVQGSRGCITRDFYGSNRGCPVLHPKDNLTCVLLHILYFLCAPSSLCTSLSPSIRSIFLFSDRFTCEETLRSGSSVGLNAIRFECHLGWWFDVARLWGDDGNSRFSISLGLDFFFYRGDFETFE